MSVPRLCSHNLLVTDVNTICTVIELAFLSHNLFFNMAKCLKNVSLFFQAENEAARKRKEAGGIDLMKVIVGFSVPGLQCRYEMFWSVLRENIALQVNLQRQLAKTV